MRAGRGMSDLSFLQKKIISFRNERDWAQFHDPKNLAEALSIEAGELLENFSWKTTERSRNLSAEELNNEQCTVVSNVPQILSLRF